jgi:hypothetical protein|tara:strand:- start:215 stop:607 length:393 start_codon:yes stop_codon:yes gene_type:complete
MLKYFTEKELQCPSGEVVKLAEGFGQKLDKLRALLDKPMVLTSACRTSAHVNWLLIRGYPASKNSFHLIDNPKYGTDTCAVDVAVPHSEYRKELIKLALEEGWTVGVAKSFVHIDRRSDYTNLPQIVYVY